MGRSQSSHDFLPHQGLGRPDPIIVAFRDWIQYALIPCEILFEKLESCPPGDAAS
jgi:hypothetical protein